MSPNINSFVGDLVAMAQAMEQVPHLQDQITAMRSQLEAALSHNQALESNIISYKQQIEDLNTKVRSLEVERDDASFRVLEAEDLAHNTLSRLRAIQTALGGTLDALDPPKPQPEPEVLQPQAVELSNEQHIPDPGQGESNPTGEQPVGSQEGTQGSSEPQPKPDQSATDPIASTGQQEKDAPYTPASGGGVGMTTTETSSAEVGKGPYFGKRYYNMPTYIGWQDWIDGGGIDADYFWRPEVKSFL